MSDKLVMALPPLSRDFIVLNVIPDLKYWQLLLCLDCIPGFEELVIKKDQ
jgi:hypothetical protein